MSRCVCACLRVRVSVYVPVGFGPRIHAQNLLNIVKCSIYSYHSMGKFLVSVLKKRRAARALNAADAAAEAATADAAYAAALVAERAAITARHHMHQQLHWSMFWHLTGIGATEESNTSTDFGD